MPTTNPLTTAYRKTFVTLFSIAFVLFNTKLLADPLLNGVATHSELGNEQFIAGLYTSSLSNTANSILLAQEDKRLQVRVLADRLSSRRFRRMWIEGIAINTAPIELAKQAKNMAAFSNMLKIKLIEGDIFTVDRSFEGVKVSLNGSSLGEVDDTKFFDLLLRTWIGPVPLSTDFRKDLLAAGVVKPGPLVRFESTRPSDERIAAIRQGLEARNKELKPAPGVPVIEQETVKIDVPNIDTGNIALPAPTVDIPKPNIADTEGVEVKETKSKAKAPIKQPLQKVALVPTQEELDDSIFDEEEEEGEELTAESLLKEQLYYTQLAKYTNKYLKYPQRAWNRGREGNIRVRVTIDRKGKVKKVELLEEAVYNALNKEAKSSVSRASPYPQIPDDIKGEEYTFTFRIVFKITVPEK